MDILFSNEQLLRTEPVFVVWIVNFNHEVGTKLRSPSVIESTEYRNENIGLSDFIGIFF